MIRSAIARRYALALFTLAKEQQAIDQFEDELKQIVELISSDPDIKKVVEHQLITPQEKKNLLHPLFAGRSETIVNFLNVIIDKRRERFLEAVLHEYVAYADLARNIVDAEVVSAVELSQADLNALRSKLSTATGKTVRVRNRIDPSIIGGVVVRMGDRILDGSVSKRLEMLRQNLKRINIQAIGVRE